MYTVLLVDDEPNVLEILKESISWNELGVDFVITAKDGRAALSIVENSKVDLIITDIKMPHMDGIELVRTLRNLYPNMHCILLTAYSEFTYAKEAIRLGVDNYLLKPVTKDEVEQTVISALDNIYKNQNNSQWLLLNNTFRRWVSGTIKGEELSEHSNFLNINLYMPYYSVIVVMKMKELSLAQFRLKCVETLAEEFEVYHFWDGEGRYVFILGGKNFDVDKLTGELNTIASESSIEENVTIAFGTVVMDIENLPSSYKSACEAIGLNNLMKSGTVIDANENDLGFTRDILAEEIRVMLHKGTLNIQGSIKKLAEGNRTAAQKEAAMTRLIKACILAILIDIPRAGNVQEELYRCVENIENTEMEGFSFIISKTQEIFSRQLNLLTPIVQLAMRYIWKSSDDGTSIKEFCEKSGSHPAYLGHLFKKEVGVFFNEYLTKHRISMSILYLQNTDVKIKDIARGVGFSSTSYYAKCFNSQKGMSPAKYRMEVIGHYGL